MERGTRGLRHVGVLLKTSSRRGERSSSRASCKVEPGTSDSANIGLLAKSPADTCPSATQKQKKLRSCIDRMAPFIPIMTMGTQRGQVTMLFGTGYLVRTVLGGLSTCPPVCPSPRTAASARVCTPTSCTESCARALTDNTIFSYRPPETRLRRKMLRRGWLRHRPHGRRDLLLPRQRRVRRQPDRALQPRVCQRQRPRAAAAL